MSPCSRWKRIRRSTSSTCSASTCPTSCSAPTYCRYSTWAASRSAARTAAEGAPIVIAGGEAVSNPFPLADFIDAFFIGDGEEGIAEIAHAVLAAKEEGLGRSETLERIGRVEGVLLPARYTFSYDGCAVSKAEGPPVRKRVYRGRGLADPVRPLVPNIRIAQERVVIELTRGCSNFCNFCHAGFYDLPYRCYDYSAAAERIDEIVRNTGYNEVTLSSLSISDYPKLTGLINQRAPRSHGARAYRSRSRRSGSTARRSP